MNDFYLVHAKPYDLAGQLSLFFGSPEGNYQAWIFLQTKDLKSKGPLH